MGPRKQLRFLQELARRVKGPRVMRPAPGGTPGGDLGKRTFVGGKKKKVKRKGPNRSLLTR
jgi:hypothetical protein